MRFRRIKYAGVRVELEWSKERADGMESKSTTLSSTDAPLASFKDALQAFKPFVVKILEGHAEWGENITVQSVSINEEGDGRLGLVITSLKNVAVANSPAVLNTPHLREDVDGTGAKGFMSRGMLDAIETIEAEAERYLKGERTQGDLFEKSESPKKDSGISTITLTTAGGKSVTATPAQFDSALTELKQRKSRRHA